MRFIASPAPTDLYENKKRIYNFWDKLSSDNCIDDTNMI